MRQPSIAIIYAFPALKSSKPTASFPMPRAINHVQKPQLSDEHREHQGQSPSMQQVGMHPRAAQLTPCTMPSKPKVPAPSSIGFILTPRGSKCKFPLPTSTFRTQ